VELCEDVDLNEMLVESKRCLEQQPLTAERAALMTILLRVQEISVRHKAPQRAHASARR